MSNSNICKIKGNKNSWKMSIKKMYKVDKYWLDHHKEIMQNTACVKGWAERSSSEAHLPSNNGRTSEKKEEEKSYSKRLSSTASKIFHHSDTTGCLRMVDQLLPKQGLPSGALPRIHLSAMFVCAAGLPQASFSSLALNYSCPNLCIPELLTIRNLGLK